jgi:PAS domain S-box-containing protein
MTGKRVRNDGQTGEVLIATTDYRGLVENASDLIVRFDTDMRHLYCNPAVELQLGLSLKACFGKTSAEIAGSSEQTAFITNSLRQVLDTGQELEVEQYCPTPSGPRCFQTRIMPERDNDGTIVSLLAISRDITALRNREADQRQRFHHLTNAIDRIDALVYIIDMVSYDVILLNQYGRKLWGDSSGRKCWQVFQQHQPGPCSFCNNAKLVDPNGDPVAAVNAEFLNTTNQRWYDCREQALRWFDGRLVKIGIATDVTDRKRIEHALRESEQKYRRLHESMMDAFARVDMNARIIETNKAFNEMLGYSAEELQQLSYKDITPKRWHAIEKRLLTNEVITKGYSCVYEKEYRRKDGTVFPVELRTFLVTDDENSPTGMWAIVRDITERHRAAEVIRQELKEKELLLKEVYHRIRNNLTAISLMLTMQIRATTSEHVQAVLQETVARVQSMGVLYDTLLVSEKYIESSVTCYIEALANTIVALYPESDKVTIDTQITDFNLISKKLFPLGIIINELLTNAMKYAFVGRSSGRIGISLVKNEREVTLTIEDNGVGLPEAFDIDRSTGFGLALMKMLLKQLDATYRIETNKGTRNTLKFNV